MNCIFILLCLLQIVYSSVDQNKHTQSAKDLQIQNYPMPKDYCWRIKFYIPNGWASGTSNYVTVQLINDETQVFSNRLSCADKCERGTQPSFYFCTPRIDSVKELKLNETKKNFWKGWKLESIDLMNLNTSATYSCTLDNPDADEKGCKLNPTVYCWRIKFYISRKLMSGTSNYVTVQLINDETQVFSNRLSCNNKCKKGSQPSFDFCTPRIDSVKELKLNETKKNFWKGWVSGWTLKTIDLMNLNTSANYSCTFDKPEADEKGCELKLADHGKEPVIPYTPYGSTPILTTVTTADKQTDSWKNTPTPVLVYCWRIKFYISRKHWSGTSNYFTVQLINDEKRVFSNRLSCDNKCKRGTEPSFYFCTPQIDSVKELKLNETRKGLWNGWKLQSIDLMNLDTSANYRCTLDNPGAHKKGCKLNPKDHGKEPVIPYTPYGSTPILTTVTTADKQTDSWKNTPTPVLVYCWRIKFYISRKFWSGTSNYFTVQLINDEKRVFSNRLSCAKKCKRGSQPSFYFCTPRIDSVKELKLNETKKGLWNGWKLQSIDLMNLNTSAKYRCTLDNPGAHKKGCKLNPKVIAM